MGIQRDLRRAGRQVMVMHKHKTAKNELGHDVRGELAVGETLTFRGGAAYEVNANGSVRRTNRK